MGKADKVIGDKKAREELKAARKNLERVSSREHAKNNNKPFSDDNPEYLKANKAVIDAEKKVPFWGRW